MFAVETTARVATISLPSASRTPVARPSSVRISVTSARVRISPPASVITDANASGRRDAPPSALIHPYSLQDTGIEAARRPVPGTSIGWAVPNENHPSSDRNCGLSKRSSMTCCADMPATCR